MTTTLKFDALQVGPLIAHAERATEWSNSYFDESDPVPCLVFVKDDGIYLMSNGIPGMERDESYTHVVYAKSYDPRKGDVWDRCRDAVGGDDFVEYLEIAPMLPVPENATHLFIKVSASELSAGWILAPERATRAKVKA